VPIVDTIVAGVTATKGSSRFTMRSKTKVCSDVILDDEFVKNAKQFDLIVVPGGLAGAVSSISHIYSRDS
jgi:putative intracellular protease/amidase